MAEFGRCFVAIKVPPLAPLRPVLRQLAEMGRALVPAQIDKLHLTLKFLGDTDLSLVPQIASIVESAARARKPGEVSVVGLGAFPRPERPNVVWAGIEMAELLVELAGDLEAALAPLQFERENRPFVPHLTLARVKAKPSASLAALLERHARTDFGRVDVAQVELLRSELGPAGPRYTVLAAAPIGSTADRK